ncbi:MAG: ATP-binding protein [Oscillospiraceae bacterium]|nr:ATP-binding protein [Oscillospiraceae bacterium]
MAYEREVMRRATERLEARRSAREHSAEERRAEIYRKIPRVVQIDRQLRETISGIITASLRTGDDPAQALAQVREENLNLQAERAELLVAHGYPYNALDEQYACPICQDRGWCGTKMCECLKTLCAEEQIVTLSSLLHLGTQSFDRFSLSYYSDLPWPGEPITPKENMEFIYDVCLNFAQKFPSFVIRNILLSGAPGLGKTFLSACIARVVAEKGVSVVYDTSVNILTRFEEQKFSKNENAAQDTSRYLKCELLIVDDLGSEMNTPFVQSALYRLINTRLMEGTRTIISTNLSMDDIYARYSGQIASRLDGEYRLLPFYGEDIRRQRKKQVR